MLSIEATGISLLAVPIYSQQPRFLAQGEQLTGSETVKQIPRLPSNPTMADIHHFLSRTLDNRGEVIEISWFPPDGLMEYRLKVQSSPRGGDAEWTMYAGSGRSAAMLWSYVSCDVLLVYNLVLSAIGQSTAGAVLVDPAGNGNKQADDSVYRLDTYTSGEHEVLSDTTAKTRNDAAPTKPRRSKALNGDLAHIQMPTLLQSVLMAKMTGCLELKKDEDIEAEIYFVNGVPTHAQGLGQVGEETLYELLGWKYGDFHFEPEKKTDAATITRNLDSLLLQGMTLIDNEAYLVNAGIKPESVMRKRHENLSDSDFDQLVANGAPLAMAGQKRYYAAIDGVLSVEEIAKKLHLSRSRWVPIMCNMVRCDLVDLVEGPSKHLITNLEPKVIDKRAIHNVMMSLRRPDTGMFTYPAFLYFLEQEYFRAYRSASPLSVVVFQMRMKSANADDPVREPLSLEALNEAVRRMSRVKRHVDLLAHYESFDYAFLLPNTKGAGVQAFIGRITRAVTAEALAPGLPRDCVEMTFGSACIPEDTLELSLLLSAAEVAKNAAQHNKSQLVLYHELL